MDFLICCRHFELVNNGFSFPRGILNIKSGRFGSLSFSRVILKIGRVGSLWRPDSIVGSGLGGGIAWLGRCLSLHDLEEDNFQTGDTFEAEWEKLWEIFSGHWSSTSGHSCKNLAAVWGPTSRGTTYRIEAFKQEKKCEEYFLRWCWKKAYTIFHCEGTLLRYMVAILNILVRIEEEKTWPLPEDLSWRGLVLFQTRDFSGRAPYSAKTVWCI